MLAQEWCRVPGTQMQRIGASTFSTSSYGNYSSNATLRHRGIQAMVVIDVHSLLVCGIPTNLHGYRQPTDVVRYDASWHGVPSVPPFLLFIIVTVHA